MNREICESFSWREGGAYFVAVHALSFQVQVYYCHCIFFVLYMKAYSHGHSNAGCGFLSPSIPYSGFLHSVITRIALLSSTGILFFLPSPSSLSITVANPPLPLTHCAGNPPKSFGITSSWILLPQLICCHSRRRRACAPSASNVDG